MDRPKEAHIKAAGYIRVSGKSQIENESLSTQRQSIKDFCKQQGWKLTEIYEDAGISGGSVKARKALLRCLQDGQDGKFNVLVIHRLSRFGRNARELLDNHHELEQAGIQLRSISEGIDFASRYGKAFLGILAVVSELEREVIREQMLENRVARGKKGIPTAGAMPTARRFDYETGKWELEEELARLLKQATDEYLQGGSLRAIAEKLKARNPAFPSYERLTQVLADRCGDIWTVQFKDQEPFTYDIPRILDDDTIQSVRERLDFNRKCRGDVRKYALTGFIYCDACGRSLNGQTQINPRGLQFQYYLHPGRSNCSAFHSVPLQPLEDAVFRTIFENMADIPAFETAIAESLPDAKLIRALEDKAKQSQKELKRIDKELEKLVDLALSGTLQKSTIKAKEASLLQAKSKIAEELEEIQAKLRTMPDANKVRQDAELIRRQLLEQFSCEGRLSKMSFDDKQRLLHLLFDGKDPDGKPYGIYVSKRGRGPGKKIDYFLYGRLTGIRTLKDKDINYQHWDEDETEYKTDNAARNRLYLLSVAIWLLEGAGNWKASGAA